MMSEREAAAAWKAAEAAGVSAVGSIDEGACGRRIRVNEIGKVSDSAVEVVRQEHEPRARPKASSEFDGTAASGDTRRGHVREQRGIKLAH